MKSGMKSFVRSSLAALVVAVFSLPAYAASKNIMVTGFWNPTNEMLRRLSANPVVNPQGWIGKNWNNSGYDVYAYFPEFPAGSGNVGTGDFRVDYAATFNDFMKYTNLLKPIAILSFGQGSGPWEIEGSFPANYTNMLQNGISAWSSLEVLYPIPLSLTKSTKYSSSLPMKEIMAQVNALPNSALTAWIDSRGGAGTYLCGFLAYLGGWYHAQHSRTSDPDYNAMSGFIHVSGTTPAEAQPAAYATLNAIVAKLPR